MGDMMVITAQSLRNAASDIEAADRALRLALAECEALRQTVARLKAEREAYFKPQIVGDVSVRAHRDKAFERVQFRAQIGSATISGAVDNEVFFERGMGDPAVAVARQAAQNIAGLIGEKIGPMLVQAMKDPAP